MKSSVLSRIRPAGGSEGPNPREWRKSRQSFQVLTELEQQLGDVLVVQRQHGAAQLGARCRRMLRRAGPRAFLDASLDTITAVVVSSHVRCPSPRVRHHHHHHQHHLQQQRPPPTGRTRRDAGSIRLSSAGPITLIDRQGASRRNPGSEECV